MDPPPLLPPFPTTAGATYPPDSGTNSSPRSRQLDPSDDPLPPASKLRLMCSYGGRIIPRPHDKSLCYVGGETRIVVVDRLSSLSDLSRRLSHSLLHGRHFSLKYQLPTEDLDSLISISTDEDLDNMIDEYDRTVSDSPLKPSRLRLFLFLAKPETSSSMGSLLDDAKSETWFVDALNGSGLLPRVLSDSATIDCLLELGDPITDLEARIESEKTVKSFHDVHSTMPDSPLVETNSSFGSGSSSSSPSMSNLPPIKVRVPQDKMVGLDEQFSQINVTVSNAQKLDDHLPIVASNVISSEHTNRVYSDDERSDHGVPTGFRKPPLPLQPVQRKFMDPYNLPSPDSKFCGGGGFNLHSPDSVTR